MDKSFFESKTVWGFGLLAIALIGQSLGFIPESKVTEIINVALGFLGIYGLRDAM